MAIAEHLRLAALEECREGRQELRLAGGLWSQSRSGEMGQHEGGNQLSVPDTELAGLPGERGSL